MEWNIYEQDFTNKVDNVFDWLNNEYSKLRTSRVTPSAPDRIKVHAYDELMDINQIANVSSPEPRVLIIKAYDNTLYKAIGSAINASDLGVNAQIDADKIRLVFPALTEDARKVIAKKAKTIAEDAKIKVRRARQDIQDHYKKDEELSDDDKKYYQTMLDKTTKKFNEQIEQILEQKTKSILTI